MAAPVALACDCGAITGRIDPSDGAHLVCFCASCRDVVRWSGQPDPGTARVAYFNTTPDRLTIDTGAEHLACLTWKNRKLLRWHAACCGAPLVNTLPGPDPATISLHLARCAAPEAFGPPRAEAFRPIRPRHRGMRGVMAGFARRALAARLSGRWRQTAFFDPDTRAPVAPVRHLTAADRAES